MTTHERTTIRSIDLVRKDAYALLNAIVAPRPIAWVGTRGADGHVNLAPHSYFTIASVSPPMVAFVSVGDKNTITNVQATREFTVSVVNDELVEPMNISSASAPFGTSEFPAAGVTAVAGDEIGAPYVGESPVGIECRLHETVKLGDDPSFMVIGEAVRFHVATDLVGENGRVSVDGIRQVARMGGITYSDTSNRFELARPAWDDVSAGNQAATPGST